MMKHLVFCLLLTSPAFAFSEDGFYTEPCPLETVNSKLVTSVSIINAEERLENVSYGIGDGRESSQGTP